MLARRSRLIRRKGIRRVSAKRRAEKPMRDEARQAVFARDGHRCQFPHHLYSSLPCTGGLTFGHVVRAGQGGAYTPENGLTLCAVSNVWCSDHPVEARRLGLEKSPWAS